MPRLTIPDEQTFAEFSVVTSTTTFPITFSLFAKADLTVLVDDVELDQSAFSFTGAVLDGGGFDGGLVTLNTAVTSGTVRIERSVAPARTSNFAPANSTPVGSVDQALNRLTAVQQDIQRAKAALPRDRAGKFLAFDAEGNEVASAGTGVDAGLRTDLAASAGGLLVKVKRAEADTVARTLSALFQDLPATPYDFGALPPVIGNDNTVALQKWLDSGPNLFLPEGVWLGRDLVVGLAGLPNGIQIKGEGPNRSVLYSDETSGAVLSFDVNESIQHILFEDFGVKGAGLAGTLSGIDFGTTYPYAFQTVIRRVEGTELGGSIIKDGLNGIGESAFAITLDSISGYSKDHNIYLGGGPAVMLIGSFPFGGGSDWLNGAGVRILQGNVILIGYSGPEKDWGAIFGNAVGDPGGYKLCQPVLIGCSIENNRVGGVDSKTAAPVLIDTKIITRWADFIPIRTGAGISTNLGWIDNVDAAFPFHDREDEPAASWLHDCPVHFTTAFPFHTVLNGSAVNFYDAGEPTVAVVFPGAGIKKLGYANYGPYVPARMASNPLTAAGFNLAAATPLPGQTNVIAAGDASMGVRLPPGFAGTGPIVVFNRSGSAKQIYPNETSAMIDDGSAAASVVLSDGAGCMFWCTVGNPVAGVVSEWQSTLLGAVSA